MKSIALILFAASLAFGCSKDPAESNRVSQSTAVEPDNSGRNVRDRNDGTQTAGDQSENEADRTITQSLRKAITDDDSISTNGKNVKVVTIDGTVTLRGPVKSEKEKAEIGAKAKQIAGVKKVDNQLEIAN
jgi:hyperosmotically inducible periplasmic protein